jgi:hypothetical protein
MKGKLIFGAVFLIAGLVLLGLIGGTSEEWDGACGHKVELGALPFYRFGISDGRPAECASGVIPSGLAATSLLAVAVALFVVWSWRRLVGAQGRYLANRVFEAGFWLLILGSGPLLTIIVLATLGLWPVPEPPIGPAMLAGFTFLPALICMGIGAAHVWRGPK